MATARRYFVSYNFSTGTFTTGFGYSQYYSKDGVFNMRKVQRWLEDDLGKQAKSSVKVVLLYFRPLKDHEIIE